MKQHLFNVEGLSTVQSSFLKLKTKICWCPLAFSLLKKIPEFHYDLCANSTRGRQVPVRLPDLKLRFKWTLRGPCKSSQRVTGCVIVGGFLVGPLLPSDHSCQSSPNQLKIWIWASQHVCRLPGVRGSNYIQFRGMWGHSNDFRYPFGHHRWWSSLGSITKIRTQKMSDLRKMLCGPPKLQWGKVTWLRPQLLAIL